MSATFIEALVFLRLLLLIHLAVHDTLRGILLTTGLFGPAHIVAIALASPRLKGLHSLYRTLEICCVLVASSPKSRRRRRQVECVRDLVLMRAAYVDLRLEVLQNLAKGLLRLADLDNTTTVMQVDVYLMVVQSLYIDQAGRAGRILTRGIDTVSVRNFA